VNCPITALRHQRPEGFSLVELLTGVAIVAVLAALALPVLRSGLNGAKQAKCSSNLRQIGLALLAYAHDNEGRLPKTSHSGGSKNSWIFSLAPYLDKMDEVRICPGDPFAAKRLAALGTSYTLNSIVFNPAYDGDGNVVTRFDRLPLIPKPSQTLLATVVSDQKFGIGADHTHSEAWDTWTAVLVDIAPDRFRSGPAAPDRTKGRSNYLYADGHVETLEAAILKALVDQGINPAAVPAN
jgi:prepilin-type N-terminal cleavage/methylation domain-containing protein/prepilin-type processing-associated H-X9-DG protein